MSATMCGRCLWLQLLLVCYLVAMVTAAGHVHKVKRSGHLNNEAENELEALSNPLRSSNNDVQDDLEGELAAYVHDHKQKQKHHHQKQKQNHHSSDKEGHQSSKPTKMNQFDKEKIAQLSQMFLKMMNALTDNESKDVEQPDSASTSKQKRADYDMIKDQYRQNLQQHQTKDNKVKKVKSKKLETKLLRMKRSLLRKARETAMIENKRTKRDADFTPEELDAVEELLDRAIAESEREHQHRHGGYHHFYDEDSVEDGRPKRNPDVEDVPVMNYDSSGKIFSDNDIRGAKEEILDRLEEDEEQRGQLAEQDKEDDNIIMFEVKFGGQPGLFIPADQNLAANVAELMEEKLEEKEEEIDELKRLGRLLAQEADSRRK